MHKNWSSGQAPYGSTEIYQIAVPYHNYVVSSNGWNGAYMISRSYLVQTGQLYIQNGTYASGYASTVYTASDDLIPYQVYGIRA